MDPYIPAKLSVRNINWEKLAILLGETNTEIGRYDGLLDGMPNPEILLSPLLRKEAELSSKIEGTQSTMSEVLEYEADENITDDRKIEEINVLQNYRKTLRWAEDELRNEREFSLSFLKEMHNMLMRNSRWDSSAHPGDFRIKQVFIGEKGASIEQAIYIPPEHFLILEYMENWEDYLRNSREERLIKTAVIHAQLEIIHPFDDGNGRIGRMLITLFLYLSGVLHRPMFYMSQYLENNRTCYYESLRNISQNNQWQEWIEFFLTAVKEQTKNNIKKVKEINELYEHKSEKFKEATKSRYYKDALDTFFKRPIINSVVFAKKSKIESQNTARNILKRLESSGLVKKIRTGKGQSPSIYLFADIINLLE
ncbi:MAG: Fic family protein [Endomicrobium sp.]|jgi:Fic family protein|nr:Fic family protein [Endomicrobium sp.]